MPILLHIIATPRGEASRTLQVSQHFLKHVRHDWKIDTLNVFETPPPPLTLPSINGKYQLLSGKALSADAKPAWDTILQHIHRFKNADAYLLSVPMWNFNIPYPLKQYIDVILQPQHLFQYTESGPEGLIKNKKMVIITSRGGDYSLDAFKAMDLQEPYLRAVFSFVGITDLQCIHAQPMDAMGADVAQAKIHEAQQTAETLAMKF